jgi:hypothetical protein
MVSEADSAVVSMAVAVAANLHPLNIKGGQVYMAALSFAGV